MRIAVGWDGRAGGYDALILARVLATALLASVEVVRVDMDESPSRDLQEDLERAFAASGVAPQVRTIDDRAPAVALGEVAAGGDASMLVLGSTHRAGFGRVLPGAVGERLLGHVGCPMAIAPRGFSERLQTLDGEDYLRVLAVGFDGSPTSRAALEFAATLGAAVNATVRVIAVDDPIPHDLRGAPIQHTTQAPRRDLQDLLVDAVTELEPRLRAQPLFERGDPATRVLNDAEEGVDLLLIGSRAHGRVGTALLGGTAKTIVRRASCPVIVLPPS